MQKILRHPLLTIDGLRWSQVRAVRLFVFAGLAGVALSGSTVVQQAAEGVGVTESEIAISLKVYISSLVTVGGACFILGRWTTRRETEQERLRKEVEQLHKIVTDLQRQGASQNEAFTRDRDRPPTPRRDGLLGSGVESRNP